MRWARIATILSMTALAACQIIPERGPNHHVSTAVNPAFVDCRKDSAPRFDFIKRVVFTGFGVADRHQLQHLQGIESAYSHALSQRFDRNQVQVVSLGDQNPGAGFAVGLHGQPLTASEWVRGVAKVHRAQFVVSGEFLDIGQQQSRSYYNRNFRRTPVLGLYANDPERMIVMRLTVHDGFSGAVLDYEDFKAWSKDSADLDRQYSLMGERFMQSPLGKALHGLLEQQSEYVSGLLSCIPLQAEVLRVVDSSTGVISSGAAQGLRPGDKFKVYRRNQLPGLQVQSAGQRAVGELVVTEVYPDYVLAELQQQTGVILRQGDMVRLW